jgi:hypothetical protein
MYPFRTRRLALVLPTQTKAPANRPKADARLVSRNRFDTSAWKSKDWLGYAAMEPGSWVMERKMLLTIKQRAERLARTQTDG